MPRADYAEPLTVVHTVCGTEVKSTYAVKAVKCEQCDSKALAGEWVVPSRGGESLEHVRSVDKYAHEQKERDELREEIEEEKRKRADRAKRATEDEKTTDPHAKTSEKGDTSGFEQDSQAGIKDEFKRRGGDFKTDGSERPGDNILVQVLYNIHDLVAERYGKAYSLRYLERDVDREFKQTLVEVSKEIGVDMALTPLQRFGFMYGSILLSMRETARQTRGYEMHDVTPEGEPEQPDQEIEVDDLPDDKKSIWQ